MMLGIKAVRKTMKQSVVFEESGLNKLRFSLEVIGRDKMCNTRNSIDIRLFTKT